MSELLARELQAVLDQLLRRGVHDRAVIHTEAITALASFVDDDPAHLVVTVHDRWRRSWSGLDVAVTDSTGTVQRTRVDERGRLQLPGIGPAPWSARVVRARAGDERRPALELNRRLPLAAALGTRARDYTVVDEGGRVALRLHEDDEGHLQAGVRGRAAGPALLRVRWTLVGRDGERHGVLVTPLAESADAEVGYDLGPLGDAHGVHVYPLESIAPDVVTVADLATTLALGWRGSARRAWTEWCAREDADPDVRARVASRIG